MDFGNLLFSSEGRVNRAGFWRALLIWLIGYAVAVGLVLASFAVLGDVLIGSIVAVVLVLIPSLISGIVVGTKRLHDRDKTGWWLLLFYVLPGILGQVAQSMEDAGVPWDLAAAVVSLWGIVELGCLRGTAGPNRYGADPLAIAAKDPT